MSTSFIVVKTLGSDVDYIRIYVYGYKCIEDNCHACTLPDGSTSGGVCDICNMFYEKDGDECVKTFQSTFVKYAGSGAGIFYFLAIFLGLFMTCAAGKKHYAGWTVVFSTQVMVLLHIDKDEVTSPIKDLLDLVQWTIFDFRWIRLFNPFWTY